MKLLDNEEKNSGFKEEDNVSNRRKKHKSSSLGTVDCKYVDCFNNFLLT